MQGGGFLYKQTLRPAPEATVSQVLGELMAVFPKVSLFGRCWEPGRLKRSWSLCTTGVGICAALGTMEALISFRPFRHYRNVNIQKQGVNHYHLRSVNPGPQHRKRNSFCNDGLMNLRGMKKSHINIYSPPCSCISPSSTPALLH